MLSDIEIAQKAKMQKIVQIAKDRLGIPEDELIPYGHYKSKVSLAYLEKLKDRKDGKLILVTAISPTPAGEGKTTTTVGLGDGLNYIGKKAMICLNQVRMVIHQLLASYLHLLQQQHQLLHRRSLRS